MTNFYSQIIKPLVENIYKFSDRNAFCINGRFYTYQDLGTAISQIRTAISDTKYNTKNVGLVINDDIQTYASIFALWLDGNGYVPLHPNWPYERCSDIVSQVGIDLILDSSKESRYLNHNVIKTSDLPLSLYGDNLEYRDVFSDENIAYILFTSGSTGKPKGVQLTRGNIGAFMESFWKTGISINENDRCLQCFDLTFDVSVQSYLVPLTKGACCFTIPNGQIKYIYTAGLIEDYKLTFGAMAPSMIRFLKPYFDEIDVSSLKYCIFTAEACPQSLIEQWQALAPGAQIYDFYGPTEATIYCTYYKVSKGAENKTLNGIISIGKPMSDVITIIIDEKGDIVPCGIKGELCVAGPQVTPGYLNDPVKNSESFFEKMYDGENVRFYHTGDLCYADIDGDIMYSGRIDHQAKIQGFRVEMGEIEHHTREFLNGTNAVCIAFDNAKGITEIAMFIESEEFETSDLMDHLKTKMPQYMIPHRVYFEPVFPLNANAKIDKVVLKSKIKI